MSVQSLRKAMKVLACFTEERPEWGVTELSRVLGYSKSTVSNILSTLARGNYVRQSPTTRRYELGLRCLELGYLTSSRLIIRDMAVPYLEVLLEESNQIVYIGIPYENHILYIEALYPPRRKVNYSSIGRRAPLHCTGIGKAVLAFLPEDRIEALLEGSLSPYTPRTITDPDELRKELEAIRQRGYALDLQEREEGIQCIAAPVRLFDDQVVGAISVSGPANEMTIETMEKYSEKVLFAARNISRKLAATGYFDRAIV